MTTSVGKRELFAFVERQTGVRIGNSFRELASGVVVCQLHNLVFPSVQLRIMSKNTNSASQQAAAHWHELRTAAKSLGLPLKIVNRRVVESADPKQCFSLLILYFFLYNLTKVNDFSAEFSVEVMGELTAFLQSFASIKALVVGGAVQLTAVPEPMRTELRESLRAAVPVQLSEDESVGSSDCEDDHQSNAKRSATLAKEHSAAIAHAAAFASPGDSGHREGETPQQAVPPRRPQIESLESSIEANTTASYDSSSETGQGAADLSTPPPRNDPPPAQVKAPGDAVNVALRLQELNEALAKELKNSNEEKSRLQSALNSALERGGAVERQLAELQKINSSLHAKIAEQQVQLSSKASPPPRQPSVDTDPSLVAKLRQDLAKHQRTVAMLLAKDVDFPSGVGIVAEVGEGATTPHGSGGQPSTSTGDVFVPSTVIRVRTPLSDPPTAAAKYSPEETANSTVIDPHEIACDIHQLILRLSGSAAPADTLEMMRIGLWTILAAYHVLEHRLTAAGESIQQLHSRLTGTEAQLQAVCAERQNLAAANGLLQVRMDHVVASAGAAESRLTSRLAAAEQAVAERDKAISEMSSKQSILLEGVEKEHREQLCAMTQRCALAEQQLRRATERDELWRDLCGVLRRLIDLTTAIAVSDSDEQARDAASKRDIIEKRAEELVGIISEHLCAPIEPQPEDALPPSSIYNLLKEKTDADEKVLSLSKTLAEVESQLQAARTAAEIEMNTRKKYEQLASEAAAKQATLKADMLKATGDHDDEVAKLNAQVEELQAAINEQQQVWQVQLPKWRQSVSVAACRVDDAPLPPVGVRLSFSTSVH